MATLMQKLDSIQNTVDEFLHKYTAFNFVLEKIEQQTGVRRLLVVKYFICGFFFCIYLIFGDNADLACNLTGFLYPAYMTLRSVENPRREDSAQWMTYWPVYCSLGLLERVLHVVTTVVPMYWFIKCCFLVWCFSSVPWNGCSFVYRHCIRPMMMMRYEHIEANNNEGKDEVETEEKTAGNVMED